MTAAAKTHEQCVSDLCVCVRIAMYYIQKYMCVFVYVCRMRKIQEFIYRRRRATSKAVHLTRSVGLAHVPIPPDGRWRQPHAYTRANTVHTHSHKRRSRRNHGLNRTVCDSRRRDRDVYLFIVCKNYY